MYKSQGQTFICTARAVRLLPTKMLGNMLLVGSQVNLSRNHPEIQLTNKILKE